MVGKLVDTMVFQDIVKLETRIAVEETYCVGCGKEKGQGGPTVLLSK